MIGFLQEWFGGFHTFILSALACTFFEVAAAVEKQSWFSRLRAVLFWSIFLGVSAAVVMSTQHAIRYFEIDPLVSVDLRASLHSQNWLVMGAAYVLLPFAPYLLFDCLYYWFHRLQHASPFLWRFHAVHHSIEELNAANCYHHASEALFRLPFIVIPLTLFIELRTPDVFVMTAVLTAWGQFVHANTRFCLGPLTYVLAGPRFHRVHHSLAEVHRDKNFASFFPVLDIMFKTAYFPKLDEKISTGLDDKREPRTIIQYLIALAPRR